jgi:hypothetical protein
VLPGLKEQSAAVRIPVRAVPALNTQTLDHCDLGHRGSFRPPASARWIDTLAWLRGLDKVATSAAAHP